MASSSQIITALEGLGAPPKIVGFFSALETLGYITAPPLQALEAATRPEKGAPRGPRNRTSKLAGPAPAKAAAGRKSTGTGTEVLATKQAVGRPRKSQVTKSTESSLSLGDATVRAVRALGEKGATPADILNYLSRELGMTARPNHVGMALARHGRASRLEKRDGLWYAPNVEELRRAS